jgi:4-hydroxyphenylpyruvate dioxygenase-like putative hemolysin
MVKDMTYRGRPASYQMKVALATVGSLIYEVIEPVEGETIYADFLAERGPGLQHLGVIVADLDEAVAALRAEGYEVLMSGRGFGVAGDGAFAYMGTEADLAAVFEFIVPPRERRPPDVTYP